MARDFELYCIAYAARKPMSNRTQGDDMNADTGKLYIIMVGLPAMGKSTVASKLKENFLGEGVAVEIFNNGDLRRAMLKENTSRPDFYDPDNQEGASKREHIALINIGRAKDYLASHGQVAILDATNVSRKRRRTIEAILKDHPLLFIECVNDDPEMLSASITRKTKLSEFAHLSPAEAYKSFERRISYYKHIHAPLGEEENYFVLDSLNNRILRERVCGRMPYFVKVRDLLVSDWVKNLFLLRHGETFYNLENRIGGDSKLTDRGMAQAKALARHFRTLHLPYVFTSTKRRTLETARPIANMQDRCEIITLPEFDEIDAGQCDGMRYEDIRENMPEVARARAADKYNYVYPAGEGYATLKERVDRGIKKALYLSGNSDNIIIVGHQAVNRMILSHFLYRRTEDVPYIYIPQDRYFHIISTQNKKLFELRRY